MKDLIILILIIITSIGLIDILDLKTRTKNKK